MAIELSKMSDKKLVNKLHKAYWVCIDCGNEYGEPRGLASTFHEERCDVCGKLTSVTEVRDYGYLRAGQIRIARKLYNEKRKENLLKVKVKKERKKIAKAATIPKLWKTASIELQAHYRRKFKGLKCVGMSKSCTGTIEVMHHHFTWGGHIPLRLESINLIPLCNKCHCSYHVGQNQIIRINYTTSMKVIWGDDWEDKLIKTEQYWRKMSTPELREYIVDKIKFYKSNDERN